MGSKRSAEPARFAEAEGFEIAAKFILIARPIPNAPALERVRRAEHITAGYDVPDGEIAGLARWFRQANMPC